MTPSVQNLNAKLSPRPRRGIDPRVAATNRHLARSGHSMPTPARITGRTAGYRGGYLVDV
jgi:hypothetical protein